MTTLNNFAEAAALNRNQLLREMQPGFLSKTHAPQPPIKNPDQIAAEPSPSQAQPGAQTNDASPQPALHLSPQQWQENFQQCLQLLEGPNDERR